MHLLAALDHTHGVLLGQTGIVGKSNGITAFEPLLDRIDLRDALITADALHTQRGHADYLRERGGHYLWIAKANQPRLHAQRATSGLAATNIAHACRHTARHPNRALDLLT